MIYQNYCGRGENEMRSHARHTALFACSVVLSGTVAVVAVVAAELPARKPGLWEIQRSLGNRGAQTIQQCIDAATDQMLQENAGPFAQGACGKRDVQRSADRVTIDSTCTIAGKTSTSHAVITGSFESAYSMTVTAQGEALPGGKTTISLEAKWLGPCQAGQRAGDVIMPGGIKVNILDLQKLGIRGASGVLPTR
jgi:Protein of unknown function (DUF3617)